MKLHAGQAQRAITRQIWRSFLKEPRRRAARTVRWFYMVLRARVVPWCVAAGCWEPSLVQDGRRGNLCSTHTWRSMRQAIAAFGHEDEETLH
jgi:hypothetical protein